MGLASGTQPIVDSLNLSAVNVPAFIVAGELDRNTPPSRSALIFDRLATPEKAYLVVTGAQHRAFAAALCDQTQSSAAIAQNNPSAVLELHTARAQLLNPVSGVAVDYCPYQAFVSPVDVRPLVETISDFVVTQDSVPSDGVTSSQVQESMLNLAESFLRATLRQHDFSKFLSEKKVRKSVDLVETVEVCDGDCPAFDAD